MGSICRVPRVPGTFKYSHSCPRQPSGEVCLLLGWRVGVASSTAGKGEAWPNVLSSDFEPSALKKEMGEGDAGGGA